MKIKMDNKWTKDPTLKGLAIQLSEVDDINFERLRRLKRTGLFTMHTVPVLNRFINACEYMHDCGIDSGFLQHVADADGRDGRLLLLNAAHKIGWEEPDSTLANITDRFVFNLLVTKGMLTFNKKVNKAAHVDGLSSFLKAPISEKKAKELHGKSRKSLNFGFGSAGHDYSK